MAIPGDSELQNLVAVAAGHYHSLGLKADGRIVAWGYNSFGQCNVPSPNTGFVAVAAGAWHSLGLKADGGTSPVVSCAAASQRTDGSKIVDIYYNLDGPPSAKYTVSMKLSSDGGTTYPITPTSVAGDIGPNVTAGTGKHIIWDAGRDLPGEYGTNYKIAVTAGGTAYSNIFTIDNRASSAPAAHNPRSPQGRYFVPGMPGTLTFKTDVDWNGTPGCVYFTINGTKLEGSVTDLGGGRARAEVTVDAPSVIDACSEVTIEVVNGEGNKTVVNTGLHFLPIPGIVAGWYQDNIPWTPSGIALTYETEKSQTLWDWKSDKLSTDLSGSISKRVAFDPLAGAFSGSLGGGLGMDITFDLPSFEIIGGAALGVAGTLEVSYASCGVPRIVPGWEFSFDGRVGAGAKLVPVVVYILGAGPVIEPLMSVPVICDLLGIPRLRLFVTPGGAVAGRYTTFLNGNCFLWSDSLSGSLTIGIEGQAVCALWGHEVGVYTGASGTPEWQLCPELVFNGVTLRGYVGAFASAPLFSYKEEGGIELRWDSSGGLIAVSRPRSSSDEPLWRPIGDSLLEYGAMNRISESSSKRNILSKSAMQSGSSTEEVILENVAKICMPCFTAGLDTKHILFTLHDAEKPWYAATDIAHLYLTNGTWSLQRVTDDEVSDFTVVGRDTTEGDILAAWARASGDVSQATSPEEVLPHLDIVVSRLNPGSNQWAEPVQLTSNTIVDRDPVPIVFGENEGVLWIQNEADTAPGNAAYGDSLMYSSWDGSTWTPPTALWSAKKGIISFTYSADSEGEGHVVFSVDEDGDLNTRTDRELYHISTSAGAWGTAVRLTSNEVEDSMPTLVTPNGNPVLVWNADGNLNYSPLEVWNPKAVYSQHTISNDAVTLDGVTMPGGAAIAYTVQHPSGVDIVASFYDASLDVWSLPRQLTNDADVESAVSLACDGPELIVAYLKNRTVRAPVDVVIDGQTYHLEDIPQPSRTDLCVLRHTLGSDLAVGKVTIEPANPVPGTTATVAATIDNRGDVAESNIEVAFYDGDPQSGGVQIGSTQLITGPMIAGSSTDVSIDWEVPSDGKSHRIYAVADPNLSVDDRDRSNNQASVACTLPDLVVESGWSTTVTNEALVISTRIGNRGVVSTQAFEVGWYIGSPEGQEIGRTQVQSLEPGGSTEVSYVWILTEPLVSEFTQICCVVDCKNTVVEADESNNIGYQLVKSPAYEIPVSLSTSAAKKSPIKTPVKLDGKVVTAVFPGCLYVEEPDRSAGIKVVTGASFNVGDKVNVVGYVDISEDEAVIIPDSISSAGQGIVRPVGLTNRALGGGPYGLQPGVGDASGLNNIGLLVRIWGKVTQIGDGYLYLDDGSDIRDGTLTGTAENVGVRVICDPSGHTEGEYLTVAGISSCFRNPAGKLQRRVLARDSSDIRPAVLNSMAAASRR